MNVTRWILRKIRGIDKARLNKHIETISKNTGKSKLYIKADIFINFLTRGCGYTDYFRGDYINLSKKEKDTFVTAKKFYKILAYLNNPKYTVLLNDKLVFNQYFKKYLKRNYINLKIATLEEFKEFLENQEVVFAKTPIGEGGHGVKKIIVKNYEVENLYHKLKEHGQFLVEEAIVQSKELNEINPNVVNSFRVITLVDKDGKIHLLNNALRINQDETAIIGCTNDLYCSFDKDGKINSNVIDDYGNIYESHPLTRKKFKDVCIKDVQKAFDMCIEAHKEILEVRYIGWDVAFSEKGPVIVEGNEYPGYGLIQHYKLKNSKTGHLKEIEDVLGEELKKIKL